VEDSQKFIQPNRKGFAADPIGYSALAWQKWGMAMTLAGIEVEISKPPSPEDLKSPVLWFAQAHAMSEAARVVLQNEPTFDDMPFPVRGVCDSQYCAVGLMLVGYSLEICLKAMIIIRMGIAAYIKDEKSYRHHRLVELSDFIQELSEKDKAILQALTHFTLWAGRYPDPGSGRMEDAEEVFMLSERHQVSGGDLFDLARRVMKHVSVVLQRSEVDDDITQGTNSL
jgi:hypothetical protein